MNKLPAGPLVLSIMVLGACAGYVLTRPDNAVTTQAGFLNPPAAGVVRVVTWNLERGGEDAGATLSSEAIRHVANMLDRLAPSAVLLQGLVSAADSEAIQLALSGEWAGESVSRRRDGAQRLAIFVRRSMDPVDQALINTAVGDRALAYNLGGHNSVPCRFICMHADSADAERRRRYCDGVMNWLERQRPVLTVLAGDFGVDVGARSLEGGTKSVIGRMGERLVDCGPKDVATIQGGGRVDYVLMTPNSGTARSAVVDGARWSMILHSPVVVDLLP